MYHHPLARDGPQTMVLASMANTARTKSNDNVHTEAASLQ